MPLTKTIKRKVSGRRFEVVVPAEQGDEPGETLITSRDLLAAELAIASSLAEEGPIDAESFRYMRSVLGLEAQRLATLLAVRPETISRWENGKRELDRSAWFTLGAVVLERAGRALPTLERLEMLAAEKKPRKAVHLSVTA